MLGWPLLALALTGWVRSRALSPHHTADPATRSFRLMHQVQLIIVACTVGSICSSIWKLSELSAALSAVLPVLDEPGLMGWRLGVAWLGLALPPLVIVLVPPLMAQAVSLRLGTSDLSWADVRQQALWAVAPSAGLTFAMVQMVGHARASQWTSFAAWGLAGFVWLVWANLKLQRLLGFTLHAVTHGDLRDRLFELAKQAGVPLQQLYVLPMKRVRTANAFAVQGGAVLVSDLLLDQLNRNEVDAVLAHEIAHLQHRHPQKLAFAFALPVTGINLGMTFSSGHWLGALAGGGLGALGMMAISRRFERTADREALRLGADGPALITALVKLSRLGSVPLRWERWFGWGLTHPSVEQRARQVAKILSLPPERAEAWLQDTPVDAEHYQVPEHSSGGVEGLFTTPFKQRTNLRNALITLFTSALVPAMLAALAAQWGGATRGYLWLAALVVTPLACAAIFNVTSVAPLYALRARLAQRLFGREAPPQAMLVGFSPHAEPRIYEGFTNWDLGFVWLEDGLLHYRGEATSFALSPELTESVESVRGAPGWIKTSAVRLRWRDASGVEHALRLTPLETRTLSGIPTLTRALELRLREWWTQRAAVPAAGSPEPVLPLTSEVTALVPRELVNSRFYLGMTMFAAIASTAACLVVRVPFLPWNGMGFSEVLITCCWTQIILMLPLARHRDEVPRSAGRPAWIRSQA